MRDFGFGQHSLSSGVSIGGRINHSTEYGLKHGRFVALVLDLGNYIFYLPLLFFLMNPSGRSAAPEFDLCLHQFQSFDLA